MSIVYQLNQLGLRLPPAATPVGAYSTWTRTGDLIFLSGHLCKRDGNIVTGKVGPGGNLDSAQAAELAELCGLELLATLDAAVGLDRINKIVKLVGFVNSTPDFTDHPAVINGASNLMVKVFGDEIGRHARSAIGAGSLPLGAAVEIEAICETD